MFVGMVLGSFTGVVGCLLHMSMCHVGMMSGFLVAASFVMLGGLKMMF